jgi:hypothetical protein
MNIGPQEGKMRYPKSKRHVVFLLAVFVGLIPLTNSAQASGTQVRVTASAADVRQGPDLNSSLLKVVFQGSILECEGQEGEWYKVDLPAGAGTLPAMGYIDRGVVEVVSQTPSDSRPEQRLQPSPEIGLALQPGEEAQSQSSSAQTGSATKRLFVSLSAIWDTSAPSSAGGIGVGAEYDFFVARSFTVAPQMELLTNFSAAAIQPGVLVNYWPKLLPTGPQILFVGAGLAYPILLTGSYAGTSALDFVLNVGLRAGWYNLAVSYETPFNSFFSTGIVQVTFGYGF